MADVPAGTVLGERFEVIGVLGYGGMATVYLARDRLREEEVALKVLHDHLARSASMRARLRREVRTAARLSSPHALVAWDIHDLGGQLALSMRVHRGLTLSEHVQQRGTLSPDAVARLGRELAEALGEAHVLGIVHRDVTPPNVLLDATGSAVLTDFGLARSASQQTMTSTAVLGTAGYAAPEVYQGVRTDPRSDLYSLGAVLYFAATGRPPFAASDPMGILRRQLDGDFTPLGRERPDLPGHVTSAIESLLQLDPHHRAADAAGFVGRLENRAAPIARLPSGGFAVDLMSTRESRPEDLVRGFAHAMHMRPEDLPPAPVVNESRFSLVSGVDGTTAHRLAGMAVSYGYVPEVVDVSQPLQDRPPLQSLLWSGVKGSIVGVGAALVLQMLVALVELSGPWIVLPSFMPPAASMTALVFAALAVIGAAFPMLGGAMAMRQRLVQEAPPDALGPQETSPWWTVPLAGVLGTAQVGLPIVSLWVGMYWMIYQVPPLIEAPRGFWQLAPAFETGVMALTTAWWFLAIATAMLGSVLAAWRYRSISGVGLPVAFAVETDGAPIVRAGASVVDRVEAELAALQTAIDRSSDRIPAAASYDLSITVRHLVAEVADLRPKVDGLQAELRRLDEGGAAAEVERLEARLARARTLSGEGADLATLERSLAAQLDLMAQADGAEDRLTQIHARLLELISLATRCRLTLLEDGDDGERAKALASKLAGDLAAVRRAVVEVGGSDVRAEAPPLPREAPAAPDPVAHRVRVPEMG